MNDRVQKRFKTGSPMLFDGAIGSRLISMGLPAGRAPEAWVIEQPERIRKVHKEYASAGAEVITTCSFGANRLRLQKVGLEDQIAEINRRAVLLAREAAGDRSFIAGDMGPTGEFFQPHGELTEKLAESVFQEQAGILAEAGIDFFLLETHYDLREASICLSACKAVAPEIPVGVTLTFNSTPRGFFTVMGNPAAVALQDLANQGAFLVGSNCTLETEGMLKLASFLSSKIDAPLLFQPNAGSPQITKDCIVYPQGPDEFARFAEGAMKLGIRAIGGCCGSEAKHIVAMRKVIDSRSSSRT